MRKVIVTFAVLSLGIAFADLAHADSECEKRIRDTGMIMLKNDPEVICKQKPSRETQDCMVDILTRAKGKLRNQDLFEVLGVCKADPRQEVRDCMVRNMSAAWNNAAYKTAKQVGSKCLLGRKQVLRRPPAAEPAKTQTSAQPKKKTGTP